MVISTLSKHKYLTKPRPYNYMKPTPPLPSTHTSTYMYTHKYNPRNTGDFSPHLITFQTIPRITVSTSPDSTADNPQQHTIPSSEIQYMRYSIVLSLALYSKRERKGLHFDNQGTRTCPCPSEPVTFFKFSNELQVGKRINCVCNKHATAFSVGFRHLFLLCCCCSCRPQITDSATYVTVVSLRCVYNDE